MNIFEALKAKTMGISELTIAEFLISKDLVIMLIAFGVAFYFTKDTQKSALLMIGAYLAYIIVPVTMKETFDLIYPGPDASPSCLKITKTDLMTHFQNNESDLKKAMVESQVPYNVELNDVNAPYIATFLVNNPNINNIGDCRLVV